MAVRAFLSDIYVSVGPLATTGQIYPVKATNRSMDSTFKLADPETNGKVSQRYVTEDGRVLMPNECTRVVEIDNGMRGVDNERVPVSQAEMASLKVSIKPNTFTGVVSDMSPETLPTGTYYIFTPTNGEIAYSAIFHMVENGAFITSEMNLKGAESVFQLRIWNGYLVLCAIYPQKGVRSGVDLPAVPEVAPLPEDKAGALIAKMATEATNAYTMPSFQSVADIAKRVTDQARGVVYDTTDHGPVTESDSMDDLLASILG